MSVYAKITKRRDGQYMATAKHQLTGGPWGPFASRRAASRTVATLAAEERARTNAWNREHPSAVEVTRTDYDGVMRPTGSIDYVVNVVEPPSRSEIAFDALNWPLIEFPGLPVILNCWLFVVAPPAFLLTWIAIAVDHSAVAYRGPRPFNLVDIAIIDTLLVSKAFPIIWYPVTFLRGKAAGPARATARSASVVGNSLLSLLGLIAKILRIAMVLALVAGIAYVVNEYRVQHDRPSQAATTTSPSSASPSAAAARLTGVWNDSHGDLYDFIQVGSHTFDANPVGSNKACQVDDDITVTETSTGTYSGTMDTYAGCRNVAGHGSISIVLNAGGVTATVTTSGCSNCSTDTWTKAASVH